MAQAVEDDLRHCLLALGIVARLVQHARRQAVERARLVLG